MKPAPLYFHLSPDFVHGILKSKSSITYCKFWSCRKSAEFQITKNFKPGFLAFTYSLMNGNKLLLSVNRNSNYYKETELLIIKPGIAVSTVSPHINVFFSVKPSVCPFVIFFLPDLLQSCYCCRGKAFRAFSENCCQSILKFVCGYSFQVKRWNHVFKRRCFPHELRKN